MQDNSQIFKNGFLKSLSLNFLVNISSMVILYASHVLLARLLGVDGYGIYFYVLSWLAILSILGKLGLDATLQRFLPDYLIKKEWKLSKGIIFNSYYIGIASGLVLMLLYVAVILSLKNTLPTVLFQTFLVSSLIIPIWVLNKISQGVFLSFKKPALSQLTEGLFHPILLILFLGLIYFSTQQFVAANIAMSAYGVLLLFALFLNIFFIVRFVLPKKVINTTAEYKKNEWILYSLPLILISGTQLIIKHTDVIMIGALLNTTQAGIYAAAARLSSLITIGLLIVNMVLTPYISELFHNNRILELQKLVSICARIATAIAIPVFIIFYFFGESILWLFGTEFTEGHTVLIIISLGTITSVISGSVGFLMTMTGHQKKAAMFIVATCVLNILLNFILIPIYEIKGAAMATAFSIALWNTSLAIYLNKYIKINSTIFSSVR